MNNIHRNQFSLSWIFQFTAVVAVGCLFLKYVSAQELGLITTFICCALTLGFFAVDYGCKRLRDMGIPVQRDFVYGAVLLLSIWYYPGF